jgi:hypothetical protein
MGHGLPPWLWLCSEATRFHHNPRLQGAGPSFVQSAQRQAKQALKEAINFYLWSPKKT